MGNDFVAARAKEKYGRGYRKHPLARNRNQWQKVIERNRALAKNNYKLTQNTYSIFYKLGKELGNLSLMGTKAESCDLVLMHSSTKEWFMPSSMKRQGTTSTFNFPLILATVRNPFSIDV